jgi:hypothetical protein
MFMFLSASLAVLITLFIYVLKVKSWF